ncbi:MAG: ATP-binding protein [Pseudomonadota bacterium]
MDDDKKLEKIAAHVPGVLYQFLLRPDGSACFPYASPGIADVYGVDPADITESADPVYAVIHEDDFEEVSRAINRSAAELTTWRSEYRANHPDKGVLWLYGESRPEALPDGGVLWHGYIVDITREKAAAAEIERAKTEAEMERERFQLAIAGANDGIFDIDFENGTEFYSDRNFEMLGAPVEAGVTPQWWFNKVHPDDLKVIGPRYLDFLKTDSVWDVAYRIRAADGSWRWWRSRAKAKRNADGRAARVIGSNTDVTELIAAREKAEAELKRAEEANTLKTEFLANMSHEIRTPLNGVLGMAQVLERSDLQTEQQRCVDVILASGETLLALINDVLDLSKIEAGMLELDRDVFEPAAIVSQALDTVLSLATAKGLALTSEFAAGSDVPRIGDAARLRQVLVNLLGNAIKFTGSGRVCVRARGLTDGLRFEVEDTGPGVPEEKREHVFDRFRQADASARRRHGGAGLGLAITREIVELAGGRIGCDAAPEGGALFWFELPMEVAEPRPVSSAPVKTVQNGTALGRVLLAEDIAVNAEIVRLALEPIGCSIDVVENGREALEALDGEGEYDLVLMDVQMPVMTGDEALRAIRASSAAYADIPIVMLTANATEDLRTTYLRDGATNYLSKPIIIDDLITVVSDLCRNESRARSIAV